MNDLEKIAALLTTDGRIIKYGVITDETSDGLIAIHTGESEMTFKHLGDAGAVAYPSVLISVYHSDFLAGYNLLETLKCEIKSALKNTVNILHIHDRESKYDAVKNKYELISQFKIIKI